MITIDCRRVLPVCMNGAVPCRTVLYPKEMIGGVFTDKKNKKIKKKDDGGWWYRSRDLSDNSGYNSLPDSGAMDNLSGRRQRKARELNRGVRVCEKERAETIRRQRRTR